MGVGVGAYVRCDIKFAPIQGLRKHSRCRVAERQPSAILGDPVGIRHPNTRRGACAHNTPTHLVSQQVHKGSNPHQVEQGRTIPSEKHVMLWVCLGQIGQLAIGCVVRRVVKAQLSKWTNQTVSTSTGGGGGGEGPEQRSQQRSRPTQCGGHHDMHR